MEPSKIPLRQLVEEIVRAGGPLPARWITKEINVRSKFDPLIDPAEPEAIETTLLELEQLGRVKPVGDEWDWIPPPIVTPAPRPTKPKQVELF